MLSEEVLQAWTNLKQKLGVWKEGKVVVYRNFATPYKLERLKTELAKLEGRKPTELLSAQDQVKHYHLVKEIAEIETGRAGTNWEQQSDEVLPVPDENSIKEKVDQLTTNLELLKTLIRAGNLNQLQELVRKAQI